MTNLVIHWVMDHVPIRMCQTQANQEVAAECCNVTGQGATVCDAGAFVRRHERR